MKRASEDKKSSPLKGLSGRDYLVSAGIILGVLAGWFLLMATLLNLVDANDSIFILVLIGAGIYFLLRQSNKKQ